VKGHLGGQAEERRSLAFMVESMVLDYFEARGVGDAYPTTS
jgi:hypothetical protein